MLLVTPSLLTPLPLHFISSASTEQHKIFSRLPYHSPYTQPYFDSCWSFDQEIPGGFLFTTTCALVHHFIVTTVI